MLRAGSMRLRHAWPRNDDDDDDDDGHDDRHDDDDDGDDDDDDAPKTETPTNPKP